MNGNRMIEYTNQINQVLIRRRVIDSPLVWEFWAGPDCMGPKSYAFAVDLQQFPGKRVEVLHHPDVMADISTLLGGLKVSFANTQGFCYIVKEEKVHSLDPVDLVEYLSKAECILFIGGRGTYKTSTLQYAIGAIKDRKIIVLDPKATPGKWLHAEAVGAGGDYEAIHNKLKDLQVELKRRLANIQNKASFERMLIISDEWWLINKNLPDAADLIFEIVTIGREVKMDVWLCSATQSVAGLGIEGEGELREAFDLVKTTKTGTKTIQTPEGPLDVSVVKAEIETDRGWIRAKHPGFFQLEVRLSKDDKILVAIAVKANGGSCAIGRISKIIEEKLPERFRIGPDASFTYHKLQAKFNEWETLGLLTKPERLANGQMSPRMVTPELKKLAGL